MYIYIYIYIYTHVYSIIDTVSRVMRLGGGREGLCRGTDGFVSICRRLMHLLRSR